MGEGIWREVDGWLAGQVLAGGPDTAAILRANAAGGLPAIDVSPLQGKFLHVLVRITQARRVLEIGTLGGYSTIWMASALPEGGHLISLELEDLRAGVARANIAAAGLDGLAEVRVGPALSSLKAMADGKAGPFDLVFIDANKDQMAEYLEASLALSRPGTVIIADNVVREGEVTDQRSQDANVLGVRKFFAAVAANPRLTATALQTVGAKGWDGFAMVVVG